MPGIVKNPIIELIIAGGFYLVQLYKCMHAGAGMEINRVKRAQVAGKFNATHAGRNTAAEWFYIFSCNFFQSSRAGKKAFNSVSCKRINQGNILSDISIKLYLRGFNTKYIRQILEKLYFCFFYFMICLGNFGQKPNHHCSC